MKCFTEVSRVCSCYFELIFNQIDGLELCAATTSNKSIIRCVNGSLIHLFTDKVKHHDTVISAPLFQVLT